MIALKLSYPKARRASLSMCLFVVLSLITPGCQSSAFTALIASPQQVVSFNLLIKVSLSDKSGQKIRSTR